MKNCDSGGDKGSKVRWQCRRGMLELDVLLLGFFDTCYDALSEKDKDRFLLLLSYPDNELFEWLMARSEPKDSELNYVINKIRNAAAP